MVVGIIGGGASGMAAALAAAENSNIEVLLLERQARVGRKLLATGNGRCNLSNIHITPSSYHGENPSFSHYALSKYDVSDTLKWFADLGLYTVTEENGRIYPYSDQANSVVDVLRLSLLKPNITVLLGAEVQRIKKDEQGFLLSCGDASYRCDKLIVACGGLAGTKLGGSMSGYKLLAKLGHKSTKLRPSLVQIKTSWPAIASLKGVRANCAIRILHNEKVFARSCGELQFTEFGISGPVVFEISRDVCSADGSWNAILDMLPDWSDERLLKWLRARRETSLSVQELLTGLLHNRLGRVLIQSAGISMSKQCAELSDYELQSICTGVKCFELALTEPMGMDSAQVTAGGILTEQFDDKTMESRLVSGLYCCGELLDIDGDCGGYNLQWAWSSGRLAGHSAGKE
ncbi:MAG: NAD(P)/FAD-dependent oxidoreductase [Oscillospiraceae bacterium]|nr:NAD(P)/FAD-dependent oxidoreductase [Oscillospiraceae bacterium]